MNILFYFASVHGNHVTLLNYCFYVIWRTLVKLRTALDLIFYVINDFIFCNIKMESHLNAGISTVLVNDISI
jgi:hypothetical protein